MDRLTLQDRDRVIACLRAGPMTVAEISKQLHLSASRINNIILDMERHSQVHALRCVKSIRGHPVNLWALKTIPLEHTQ
ncbi:hypothetical protein [Acidithiobacillus thiooxidans]|uniref:DprA winged helix domain-containing protein n=1 Tax=Acidithiobacillus thiooxidans TaxID=930 RepID=A0A1C2I5B9_ACITH|nr:hypothetical protein [Acidithiobacillus thiooxidans]OCX71163.1 hypothetical protein A6M23_12465 [Acidithiobacillus thiooxidans]OCX84878.1 hypothetical protein A6P08_08510 [Acidithiobacillus thiooxidans]